MPVCPLCSASVAKSGPRSICSKPENKNILTDLKEKMDKLILQNSEIVASLDSVHEVVNGLTVSFNNLSSKVADIQNRVP